MFRPIHDHDQKQSVNHIIVGNQINQKQKLANSWSHLVQEAHDELIRLGAPQIETGPTATRRLVTRLVVILHTDDKSQQTPTQESTQSSTGYPEKKKNWLWNKH